MIGGTTFIVTRGLGGSTLITRGHGPSGACRMMVYIETEFPLEVETTSDFLSRIDIESPLEGVPEGVHCT